MAIKQLSDGHPDGTKLGQSASDKVGFWGKAPAAQPAAIADATDAATAISQLNLLLAAQRSIGVLATS